MEAYVGATVEKLRGRIERNSKGVLYMPEKGENDFRQIVYSTDFSSMAIYAAGRAKRLGERPVILVGNLDGDEKKGFILLKEGEPFVVSDVLEPIDLQSFREVDLKLCLRGLSPEVQERTARDLFKEMGLTRLLETLEVNV